MNKQISLALLAVFALSVVGVPQVPCPDYFRYVRSTRTKEIMGRIDIPYDGSTVLYLEVNASMVKYHIDENSGPTNKLMKLELYTPRTELVKYEVDTVTYTVKFPNQQNIPQITVIIFNDILFCRGPIPSFEDDPDAQSITHMFSTHELSLQQNIIQTRSGIVGPDEPDS